MKNKNLLLGLATVVCLVITVVLWFAVNKSDVEYTEVEATVLSSESYYVKVSKTGQKRQVNEVSVEYNGKTYDLKNVHSSGMYSVGRKVTAYMSNDKLYANVEGVKSSTPLSIVYFVFLFSTFGLFFVTVTQLSKSHSKKK